MDKNGTCEICGKPCYIECSQCYAVLHYQHQPHNCPIIDDGFEEEDLEVCEDCPNYWDLHNVEETR